MDALTKPANLIKEMNITSELAKPVHEIYSEFLYPDDVFAAKPFNLGRQNEFKKLLKKYSNQEQIAILNYFRVSLKSELNAFNQEKACANRYDKSIIRTSMSSIYPKKMFAFEDKINIVEEMLRETIMKERKRNKIRHILHYPLSFFSA